jgi:hypothetical protein
MAHKPESRPWLPEVTPPADLTQSIMADILVEPSPDWETVQLPANDAQQRKHTFRSYIIIGVVLVIAFYLLLPILPATLWEQAKQVSGLLTQVGRVIAVSFRMVTGCLAYLVKLIQPLFTIVKYLGKTCASVLQVVTTGPLLPLSMAFLALTLLGNGLLVHLLTRQPLLSKS